jgi:hypothetical protein
MLFTIGIVLLIAICALVWFLRERRNRQAMGNVLGGHTTAQGGKSIDRERGR